MTDTDKNENENNEAKENIEAPKDDEVFLAPKEEETAEEDKDKKRRKINYNNLLTHDPKTKIEVLDNISGDKYDINFKIIVIGNSGVGKSCLTLKATQDIFKEDFASTIGFQFFSFHVKINDKILKLQIWDTCGQEIYRSLISSFYRNASLAMMVYAINSKESFSHIETWLKEVKLQSNPDIKIFLIGNKADLSEEREVSSEEAKQFKDESGIHFFNEASAKSGLNAQEVFVEAAKLLYSEHLKYKQRANKGNGHGGDVPVPVKINNNKGDRKQGGCCS